MGTNKIVFEGKKLTIISQNLFNYRRKNVRGKEQVNMYAGRYKADIYAFQEYPDYGSGRTFYTAFYGADSEYEADIDEVEKVWRNFFPWTDFPKRYWSELAIRFHNEKIVILNLHIACSYSEPLRLVLLERLKQLADEQVVLAGDFNAAFSYQTEQVIWENDRFLSQIIKMGYKEMTGEDEKEDSPHYTYVIHKAKTDLWERKKLDHIFVSKRMLERDWKLRLEYIDDVNLNLMQISDQKPLDAFSDHSGLRLIIEAENP